ncbi:MAG: AAA family ATPase, partial [Pseudomonadota bacterium]
MRSAPLLVVCMGVSGAGKSTLAAGLATRLGASFVEADDLHAPAAIEQLRQGRPLSDRDRAPWMRRVTNALNAQLENGRDCVEAHSALRRAHLAQLRSLGAQTVFLHLHAPQAA